MNLLRNVIGLLFFTGIILPFVGYYPITFLVAWRQVENTKNWETTRCIANCMSSKTKSYPLPGYSSEFWINYGFKSRLEQPKVPLGDNFPKVEHLRLDPTLSKEERSKKTKEYFEKRKEQITETRKKSLENQNKYDREMQIFQKEQQKYMNEGTKYFSVFQLNGWRYWRNHGWSKICYDEFNNRRKPGFETDCYIDPNHPEKAVFYRELGLNWFWIIVLILNTVLMFGFLYLAIYLFIHEMKKERKTSTSLFTN